MEGFEEAIAAGDMDEAYAVYSKAAVAYLIRRGATKPPGKKNFRRGVMPPITWCKVAALEARESPDAGATTEKLRQNYNLRRRMQEWRRKHAICQRRDAVGTKLSPEEDRQMLELWANIEKDLLKLVPDIVVDGA
eukprot:15943154-Heterocapsa_arctica.AAC.1